jgi:hypothetical protein
VFNIKYSSVFCVNKSPHSVHVEHCGEIYLHKILRNTVCWTLGRFICTKYWGILYVEHRGKIYLHTILPQCSPYSIPQYFVSINLPIVLNIKYSSVFCVNKSSHSVQHKVFFSILMLKTVRRFIYTKYWGILYVEHCENIYLHKILGITSCWTLWE